MHAYDMTDVYADKTKMWETLPKMITDLTYQCLEEMATKIKVAASVALVYAAYLF